MARDLHTLIRLHQYRVDDKRRSLGELLGEVANLEKQGENLEKEIVSEQSIANSAPESIGMFYGEYAAAAVQKRENISLEIAGVEEKIVVAQEEMRVEFKDLKVFEITQEARDEADALEASREEQAILDELGQEAHRRRRTENS